MNQKESNEYSNLNVPFDKENESWFKLEELFERRRHDIIHLSFYRGWP